MIINQIITFPGGKTYGTGRLKDWRREKDFHEHTERRLKSGKSVSIPSILQNVGGLFSKKSIPADTFNKQFLPPIVDQGLRGSCTGRTMYYDVGYNVKRAYGKEFLMSALANYKFSRWLQGIKGDGGSTGSGASEALRLCGAVPLKYHHDDNERFDEELSAMELAVADNYEVSWFRLDAYGESSDRKVLLAKIKQYLAAGLLVRAAVCVKTSFEKGDSPGAVPCPVMWETTLGWHEILLTDIHSNMVITNTANNVKTVGAIEFPNSWGVNWGVNGFGFLSDEIILHPEYSTDFTVITGMDWVGTGNFRIE